MKIGLIDVDGWEDIKGYEGLYQISNNGKVKSLKRISVIHGVKTWINKEKIMKPSKDKKGYLVVNLNKDGRTEQCKVHRLVAIHFIGESDKKCVCHRDNNPSNNNIKNLYWGTDLENQIQAWEDGLHKSNMKVCSIDKNGNRKSYNSQTEASIETGIPQQNISKCICGKRKTAGGYKWVKE